MMSIKKMKKVTSKTANSEECAVCHESDKLVNITEMDFGLRDPNTLKVCVGCTKRTVHKLFSGVSVPNDAHDMEAFLDENENIKTIIFSTFKKGQAVKAVCAKGVYDTLDAHVYGHSSYKKSLALSVARHLSGDMKENLLVVGSTGIGKTLAIETIGKMYDIPVFNCNAAMLTAAGYKGNSIDELGKGLLRAAGGDISRAETGIIFLDEIDKVLNTVFAGDVVSSLLRLMENDYLKTDSGLISTKNVLFIMGGTFRDIFNKRSIAISTNPVAQKSGDIAKALKDSYGLTDEFIGRLSGIAQLDRFTEADFQKMLREQPRVALSDIYKFLGKHGATLELSESFIIYAAKKAIEIGLGVRGLKTVVKDELFDVLYSPELAKNSKIVLQHVPEKEEEEEEIAA